jgi:pimeloyl-ACP methyl ester carboxylesterase
MSTDSQPLRELVARYDPTVFEPPAGTARVRLEISDGLACDALIEGGRARLMGLGPEGRADALLRADSATWMRISRDLRGGLEAFRRGRLAVRRNLHVGVGFLAATGGMTEPGRLEFAQIPTAVGEISIMCGGAGDPVLLVHGLGTTKVSFLPTLAALARSHRVFAMDLPGFGDSVKPLGAGYDPPYFARAIEALMDSLEIGRASVVGNSMGGRVALETGMLYPERVDRLVLLAPALAWLRGRTWAPVVRLLRPELGLLQVTPRPLAESVLRRLVPGARDGWVDGGIDEFLRSYTTARGRAAFYAALRNIYLDEPHGDNGFWTRLERMQPECLFVWGTQDTLVPAAFAQHVERAVPHSRHLELDCGHVPQLERPAEVHAAVRDFLGAASAAA